MISNLDYDNIFHSDNNYQDDCNYKINDYNGDDIDYECDDEDEEENGELVCSTAAGRLIGSLKASFLPHLMLRSAESCGS